jgi:hypothetical protein
MPDRVTREVEGNLFVVSGSLDCPSDLLCDVTPDGINVPTEGPKYEAYVRRHCRDHGLGEFDSIENAERNLGIWCFYYFHKFIWSNPELLPMPFWEIHVAIAQDHGKQMTQIEVPRQCQKTSIGARAHTVFEHLHEFIVNDRRNFRTIIRSATGKNTRDTLTIIRRMSTKSPKIAALYGTWQVKCHACTATTTTHVTGATTCGACGEEKKTRVRRIALINDTRGAGGMGADMISFRWMTDAPTVDAVAAYSIWVAGLETETTGQRPDRYKWDDPQTDKNSRTVEMRHKIIERFDDSVRQLQFGGRMLVLDTRKFVDDFAGKIRKEPLASLFFSLHRKVRWPVEEPDAPPYVVNGFRYYYPVKGTGEPALDETTVNRLESQMSERNFSAEYMNEPLDPSKALFKRPHFPIIKRESVAFPEITAGLGRQITPQEQRQLDNQNLRVIAYNFIDPAGKEEQSVKGDDTFIVGLRINRYGAIFITKLAAGKWPSSRIWDEIAKADAYNKPIFNEYEMPASEHHVQRSYEKWVRDRRESLSTDGAAMSVGMPMRWFPQPKSTKPSRVEGMESWTSNGQFFILEDAAEPELIEKYIGQWVGWLVADHDDGPDATSRVLRYLRDQSWAQEPEEAFEPEVALSNGTASVPLAAFMGTSSTSDGLLWGQKGGVTNAA